MAEYTTRYSQLTAAQAVGEAGLAGVRLAHQDQAAAVERRHGFAVMVLD